MSTLKLDGTAQDTRYKVNSRSKFKPPNTAYCRSWSCLCEVQLRDDGRCPRCLQYPEKRNVIYRPAEKRFREILRINKKYIDSHTFDMKQDYDIQIPVHIGHHHYAVPLRYFVEFENITDPKSYPDFFEYIMRICDTIRV